MVLKTSSKNAQILIAIGLNQQSYCLCQALSMILFLFNFHPCLSLCVDVKYKQVGNEMHVPTSYVGNKPTTSILSSWVWA